MERLENYCRTCISGEGHYKVSCNTCEKRISRAKGIVPEVLDDIIVEEIIFGIEEK